MQITGKIINFHEKSWNLGWLGKNMQGFATKYRSKKIS
jgi:hypothetical protein